MTPTEILEPRIAAWFVDLCAAPDESDAILGDLREEFVTLTRRDGAPVAKRWYRRQAIRTAAALIGGAFRSQPGVMAMIGILGLLATFPVYWLTDALALRLVARLPVYHYVGARAFWSWVLAAPFIFVGIGIARVVRRQPMAAACAMALTIAFWSMLELPIFTWWFGGLPPTLHSPAQWLMRWVGSLGFCVPTLLGGAIGRKWPARANSGHARSVSY